ncbi:MAG: DUF2752 domain-containing protein [Rubripirellula sp.]
MENTANANPYRKWIGIAVVLLAVGGGLAILRTHAPTDASFYPKCMLHQWTGLHCPGCGGTRAMAALSHGHLWEAIRFNPLLIIGGPLIFAVVVNQRRRERLGGKGAPRMIWTLFAILVLYSIARNIPSPTRSPLAPPVPASPIEIEADPSQAETSPTNDQRDDGQVYPSERPTDS